MSEKIKTPALIENRQDKTRTFGYLKQQFHNTFNDYCAGKHTLVKPKSLKSNL